MSRVFLNICSVALGVILFSSCVDSAKRHNTLEKVDQDSTNVIADVSTWHTGPPLYHGVGNNLAVFKFVDQKNKDHLLEGNCNCVGTGLERGEPKIIQYKIPKTNLAKGVYKVYLSDDETANKYKTIEIK